MAEQIWREEEVQTYEQVLDDDRNMLYAANWRSHRLDFMQYLETQTHTISAVITHHLSLNGNQPCVVSPRKEWLYGSYNVCIVVSIANCAVPRVVIRCPLPYINTDVCPNMTDEKVRGEAGTWAWMTEHCPGVPLARLRGFGLQDGSAYTPIDQCYWPRRIYEKIRRTTLALFNIQTWRPFVVSLTPAQLRTGYTIMDFAERGQMLGSRFFRMEPHFRDTLSRSIARIMLEMLSRPLPRIGAFTVCRYGDVTLSSRALTNDLAQHEAEGNASGIQETTTYTHAHAYVDDLISAHETQLNQQPNAVWSVRNAKTRMSTVVALKALRSSFSRRDHQQFALQLTDWSSGNIFVDDQGNITAIVDYEFSCSLPVQMLSPPTFLTGYYLDGLLDEDQLPGREAEYDRLSARFFTQLAEEEISAGLDISSSRLAMQAAFSIKSHWYFTAVHMPCVASVIWLTYLQPMIAPDHLNDDKDRWREALSPYYTLNSGEFIHRKQAEHDIYNEKIKILYGPTTGEPPTNAQN